MSRRRWRWPRRRRRVVVRVVNCASVSVTPGRARHSFELALTKPGKYGRPDVVLADEMGDVPAELVAELHGWEAAQFGDNNDDPRHGSAIAWDPGAAHPLGDARLVLGSPAGEGIRARYAVCQRLRVRGHRATFNAGHPPPARAPRGRSAFLEAIHRLGGIFGGDTNTRLGALLGKYTRKVVGLELMHLFVPRWIPTGAPAPVDIDSDHPGLDVPLWA